MFVREATYNEMLNSAWKHTKELKMEIMCLKYRLRRAGAISKFDLAEEAIMKFGHPEMHEKAMNWLEEQKNLGAF